MSKLTGAYALYAKAFIGLLALASATGWHSPSP